MEEELKQIDAILQQLLSNVPTPEIVKAGRDDFKLLIEYANAIDFIWITREITGFKQDIPRHLEILGMLISTYTLGYRKGRAATPLTLVVAPDEQEGK